MLISSLIATAVMTIFSFLFSAFFRREYQIPIVISHVLADLFRKKANPVYLACGWLGHFVIGIIFSSAFYFPHWARESRYDVSLMYGFAMGCAFGAIGCLLWRAVFYVTPFSKPLLPYGYYVHLYLAHILFAVALAIAPCCI